VERAARSSPLLPMITPCAVPVREAGLVCLASPETSAEGMTRLPPQPLTDLAKRAWLWVIPEPEAWSKSVS
jgi:hypothetical protein